MLRCAPSGGAYGGRGYEYTWLNSYSGIRVPELSRIGGTPNFDWSALPLALHKIGSPTARYKRRLRETLAVL
jgi:hypothetical protein